MWGGTADRNMVSNHKGLPTTWDVKTKKNVKWVAELGSQTYGNTVVASGHVYVGTNNEAMKDPNSGDKGILMAFRVGRPVHVAAVHDTLAQGRANDCLSRASVLRRSSRTASSTTCRIAARYAVDADGFRDGTNDDWLRTRTQSRGRRRHHLALRHDGRARRGAAQHGQLVPGNFRNWVREHLERPGREPRHVPSPKARRSSRSTRPPRSGLEYNPWARRSCTASVVARGRQDRRLDAGGHRAGRRLRARLRNQDR